MAGAVDQCMTVNPPAGASVYCDFGTAACSGDPSAEVVAPGVCALYQTTGGGSCRSDEDCGPTEACSSAGTCEAFGCSGGPGHCPTGSTLTAIPHSCDACLFALCPAGTSSSGGSSSGSSGGSGGGSSGGTTGGSGGGCLSDADCAANLPPGYAVYCDYSSAYCFNGATPSEVVEVPGSCVVYDTGATTCQSDADCGPDAVCSLPPGCGGGSGCGGTCMPMTCPLGPTCPADCPAQPYPHSCPACTCSACLAADGGAAPDAGGCTSDLQCPQYGLMPSYCDFTVEACGQPIGGYVELPGSCRADESAPSCNSDADCDSQSFCALATCGNPPCSGTCQPLACTQPPPLCSQGCALTNVPHQCPACVCPATSCCLLCN